MSSVPSVEVLMESLYFAYRKAKADVYYRFRNPLALLAYETELENNIEALAYAIWNGDDSFFHNPNFTGSATFAPKGLARTPNFDNANTVFSSPSKSWNALIEKKSQSENKKIEAEYRLVSECGVGMHVLSALWVRFVGADIENQLFAGRPYANRIRRTRKSNDYNRFSIGTFDRYLDGYREWINNATDAMDRLITKNKDIVSFSTDASAYFHSIPTTILEDREFTKKYLTHKDEAWFERRLTKCMSIALKSWESNTLEALAINNSDKSQVTLGLPVGLSCSALIGNVILDGFDKDVLEQVKPEYYGRYVDDISIVMEGHEELNSPGSLWKWLGRRIENLEIGIKSKVSSDASEADSEDTLNNLEVAYYPFGRSTSALGSHRSQIGSLKVDFKVEKTHLLLADHSSGKRAVDALRNALQEKSSEWRLLSHLPANSKDIGPDMIAAFDTSGSPAVRSSQLKELSAQRGSVSLWLRDLEQLARLCDPGSWESHRAEFYKVIREQIFTPLNLFDYYGVVRRVLDLALLCGDSNEFSNLIASLKDAIDALEKHSQDVWHGSTGADLQSRPIVHWREALSKEIQEMVHCTSPSSLSLEEKRELIEVVSANIPWKPFPIQVVNPENIFFSLFKHDLAQLPFKELLAPTQLCTVNFQEWNPTSSDGSPLHDFSVHQSLEYWLHPVPDGATEMVLQRFNFLHGKFWTNILSNSQFEEVPEQERANYTQSNFCLPAIWFPTRPLSVTQAISWSSYLRYPSTNFPVTNQSTPVPREELSEWVRVLRGFSLERAISDETRATSDSLKNPIPPDFGVNGEKIFVPQPESSHSLNPRIAVASLNVDRARLNKALAGNPKLDFETYRNFSLFIDRVVSPLPEQRQPDYLLLPELALPAVWFESFAGHLASKHKMGLISGVEYQLATGNTVRNQIWVSLPTTVVGYPIAAIYKQDKQYPAHHEARKLREYRGQVLEPESSWNVPPIIWHGNFAFSLLICSELTNINYRSHLRGKIDTLFVSELNRDLKTFEALVESAALDIHAFVAQSNTREFGDSRIRGPMKDDYSRDIVRARGGLNDHFVVGQLSVTELRKFQSQNYAEHLFKPTPDGFREDFDPNREVIP